MKNQTSFVILLLITLKSRAQTETDFPQDSTTNEEESVNFCKELYPYCFCGISPIILQCRNFSKFSQLNFSLLLNPVDQSPRKIYELELEPLSAIPFDQTLNLSGISLYGRAILHKISGLELNANPFHSIKENNYLNLYLYDVNLETLDHSSACQSNLPTNYVSLFSSFNFLSINQGTYTYSGYLCPLAFKDANLRKIEIYNLEQDSTIRFSNVSDDLDLNTNITLLTIYSAKNFNLSLDFLNPKIFNKLEDLSLDYVDLKAIEENIFENFTSLRKIALDLPDLPGFIRSSDNEWMNSLNLMVESVNYSNPDEIAKLENKTLLITFNSRNGKQYSFPNSDLERFKYFPHDRFVFARILVDQDIDCSDTLKFLFKNSFSYPDVSFLNTTSAYKCFLTPSEQTSEQPSTTTSISHSPKPSDNKVPLETFLGTIIPLGIISVFSLGTAIFLYIKIKKLKSKDYKNSIELF